MLKANLCQRRKHDCSSRFFAVGTNNPNSQKRKVEAHFKAQTVNDNQTQKYVFEILSSVYQNR
jgi:hypothetical protein